MHGEFILPFIFAVNDCNNVLLSTFDQFSSDDACANAKLGRTLLALTIPICDEFFYCCRFLMRKVLSLKVVTCAFETIAHTLRDSSLV